MTKNRKTTILIILDGYGHGKASLSNAIYMANTPVIDKLQQHYPFSFVSSSGIDIGLPFSQMGNSEVGHMSLGAGRIVHQNLTRINQSIKNDNFFKNQTFISIIDKTVFCGQAIHIMGLMSPGGVHSHEDHINAMIELAFQRQAKKIYIHAFLDGRDTPPRSAKASLVKTDILLKKKGIGRIVSLIGRYFAMDRDHHWNRVQYAYDLIVQGKANFFAKTAVAGLIAAYKRNESDEFVQATVIGENVIPVNDGDAIFFMNFRADRAREITSALVDKDFNGFKRNKVPVLSDFVMLTQYGISINTSCAYPPLELPNTLGEYMEKLGKTQLRIAETEKYAHVTFFFSGGREEPYKGERRVLVNSPQVATYDHQPEMSAPKLTNILIDEIKSGHHDLVICNYANCDMVGHTGVFDATIQAVEAVDQSIGRVLHAVEESGNQCLITSDHGNAEQMIHYETGQAHTAHTCAKVPVIYFGQKTIQLQNGILSDIAPTLLDLMDIQQPKEMTGKSLLV